ncbi:MAG: heparinase II/III family protein [Planctomycetota bacterium]
MTRLTLAEKTGGGDGAAPRLLIEAGGWPAYRRRVLGDARLAPVRDWVLDEARALLSRPPQAYELDASDRLLTAARYVLMRTMVLAQAYRLTGEPGFADRARRELLHAAAYPDWGPRHLLDTAELCTAVALGLDWLGDDLPSGDRVTLRRALRDLGLRAMPDDHWCWSAASNWNQVCCAGATLAALALREDEPRLSAATLRRTRHAIGRGLSAYEPSGLPYEGVGYWSYGATYNAVMFSALETACGDDPRRLATDAFRRSAEVRNRLHAPSGRWWSFADSFGENRIEPALLWFARVCDRPALARHEYAKAAAGLRRYLGGLVNPVQAWLLPLMLVWPGPAAGRDAEAAPAGPRAWSGRGPVPLAILEDDGAYVGVKAGRASVPHAHLDIGGFVAELAGQRWAVDLGGESYAAVEPHLVRRGTSLWDMGAGSGRWRLRRYQNQYHNTLTIGDALQDVDAAAEFVEVGDRPHPHATLDLTPVYAGQAERVARRVSLPGPRCCRLEDTLTGVAPGREVTQTWITDARVARLDGRTLTLDRGGVRAVLATPGGGDVAITYGDVDAGRPSFESPNPGVTRVRVVSPARHDGRHVIRTELRVIDAT